MDLRIICDQAVLPGGIEPATVSISGGIITEVLTGAGSGAAAMAVTAQTSARARSADDQQTVVIPQHLTLAPGLVDTHVHVNEPGRTEWEGFATATAAAAAGGVTTILDMPLNSVPVTTTAEALRIKRAAARPQVRVDVGFWGGAVPENLETGDLEALWAAGVYGFKAFTSPSGIPEFGHLDRDQLLAAARRIAAFDGLLIVHAEDPELLHQHANLGTRYQDFLDTRPDDSEVSAVAMVIEAARQTGVRAHILHVSSARLLPLIAQAKADGVRITAETCPHYLTLAAEAIPEAATQYKCCPPIRSLRNQDALWQGLLDGTIDCIVSDHSPATAELKLAGNGDWGKAWGGVSSLQTSLAAVWTEAQSRDIDFARVVDWMATAPARLVGLGACAETPSGASPDTDARDANSHDTRVRLAGRGVIAVGARADLAVFDLTAEFTVHVQDLEYRNPVTAYDGARLRGRTVQTLLGGQTIYSADDGQVGPAAGRLLTRAGAVHPAE